MGCTESGTGVLLTVDGPAVDRLTVAASYSQRTVTREVTVKRPLPAALLAEVPAGHVSFHVTGYLKSAIVGAGDVALEVAAHHIEDATVHLGAVADGGISDATPDLARGEFTTLHGGASGLYTGVWTSGSDTYVTSRAISGNDLWVSGGGAFVAERVGSAGDLDGVWGDGTTVFVAGSAGALYHGSDTSWTLQSTPAGSVDFHAVFGSGGDVYAVGSGNTIVHAVAGGWVLQTAVGTTVLYAVWGGAGGWWAVGSGGAILHSSGDGTWAAETSGTQATLRGVFGADGAIWAVGDGVILHSSGDGAWTVESVSGPVNGVWASGGEVWAAGESLFHSTGGAFSTMPAPVTLSAVFGTSTSNIFFVGDQQTILHRP